MSKLRDDFELMKKGALAHMLLNKGEWKSLLVDYHPPVVERIYMDWYGSGYRVYFHLIHPCNDGESLIHVHPWPSIVEVYDGIYRMGVGFNSEGKTPKLEELAIIEASRGFIYEMNHPDQYHFVQPLIMPSFSLMFTGKPFPNTTAEKSSKQLGPLSEERFELVYEKARKQFPLDV